jgi:hypothetical protein
VPRCYITPLHCLTQLLLIKTRAVFRIGQALKRLLDRQLLGELRVLKLDAE